MAKSGAQLDREIAMIIAGDAELEGRLTEAKAIRKQGKAPRTGARGGPLMGYTASGKPVHAPSRSGAPDTNNINKFIQTKAKFPGWTKADHMDAARFHDEAEAAATAAGDTKLAKTHRRWHSVHWDIGGRWTSPEWDARYDVPRERRVVLP